MEAASAHEALGKGVEATVGTKKAQCVVCGSLADEVHILRGLHILRTRSKGAVSREAENAENRWHARAPRRSARCAG